MYRVLNIIAGLLAMVLLTTASAAQEYRVQPGDTLRIEVVEDSTLNRSVLVSPDGRISLPGAGAIRAGGRTIEQIQAAVRDRLAANFVSPPNVFVDVATLAPEPEEPPLAVIFVTGEATTVGRVEIEPHSTLLQAIAQFGGFTNFAATKRIQLHRGSQIYIFDYEAITAGTSDRGSTIVHEGDVIVVPQRRLFE